MTAAALNALQYVLLALAMFYLSRAHYDAARRGAGLGTLYLACLLGLEAIEMTMKAGVALGSFAMRVEGDVLQPAPYLLLANVPVWLHVLLAYGFLLAMRHGAEVQRIVRGPWDVLLFTWRGYQSALGRRRKPRPPSL